MTARPEAISPPPKNADASDGKVEHPAEKDAPASGIAAEMVVEAASEPTANVNFASTNQHVAGKQKLVDATERFTHTKQNIALINDPKNGPRFTLTKKELGLVETAAPTPPSTAAGPGAGHARTSGHDPMSGGVGEHSAAATTPATTHAGAKAAAEASAADAPAADHRERAKKPAPFLPGVPPAAERPSKVPVDSSKTFVGPNGTYYDKSWRWMDWRGTKISWNWPAALTFGHWFAYRRLYGHAAVYLGCLMALAAALVNNIHVAVVAGLFIALPVLTGLYANTLYFLVFRRAVAHVTEKGEGSYDELKGQLADAGGINAKAPWFMAGLTIGGIGLALLATIYGRSGFLINLWPL